MHSFFFFNKEELIDEKKKTKPYEIFKIFWEFENYKMITI